MAWLLKVRISRKPLSYCQPLCLSIVRFGFHKREQQRIGMSFLCEYTALIVLGLLSDLKNIEIKAYEYTHLIN